MFRQSETIYTKLYDNNQTLDSLKMVHWVRSSEIICGTKEKKKGELNVTGLQFDS